MAAEMIQTEGLQSSLFAYNALISGCASSRGYDRAIGYFNDMVSRPALRLCVRMCVCVRRCVCARVQMQRARDVTAVARVLGVRARVLLRCWYLAVS